MSTELSGPASWTSGAHDTDDITVRLVRTVTGPQLVLIRNAHPWVLRRPCLVPDDVG